MRDYGTGDILYKLNLNHPIISVGQADYRGNGANDLILCSSTGEVRGYERSKINLNTMKCSDQDELLELLTQKKVLLAEISHYESNEKINRDKQNDYEGKFVAPEGVGVIPSNTRLQIAIYNNIDGDVEVNVIEMSSRNLNFFRIQLCFDLYPMVSSISPTSKSKSLQTTRRSFELCCFFRKEFSNLKRTSHIQKNEPFRESSYHLKYQRTIVTTSISR